MPAETDYAEERHKNFLVMMRRQRVAGYVGQKLEQELGRNGRKGIDGERLGERRG